MNIYEKLALVKTEIGVFVKSLKNDFANFTYTNLSDIFNTLNGILEKHKLLFNISSFEMNLEKSQQQGRLIYSIKAKLIDAEKSADVIKYCFDIPADDEGKKMKLIQAAGSTFTYGTRYVYGVVFSLQFSADADAKSKEPDESVKHTQKTNPISDLPPLKKLQDTVKAAYELLGYEESEKENMNDEFLGQEPIAEDYEMLLKELRKKYKLRSME